jgi:hypothetical protein
MDFKSTLKAAYESNGAEPRLRATPTMGWSEAVLNALQNDDPAALDTALAIPGPAHWSQKVFNDLVNFLGGGAFAIQGRTRVTTSRFEMMRAVGAKAVASVEMAVCVPPTMVAGETECRDQRGRDEWR